MQLMLHRRLLVDDHWGVGEALNETAYGEGLVARGKHYLLFDFVSALVLVTVGVGLVGVFAFTLFGVCLVLALLFSMFSDAFLLP